MEVMVEILTDQFKAKNGPVALYSQKKTPFTHATMMMTYWVIHMMTEISSFNKNVVSQKMEVVQKL